MDGNSIGILSKMILKSIYGKNYKIEYPPFQDDNVVVGWIKISNG